MTRSICVLICTDSSNDTLWSLRVSINNEPSSNRGMNSVPIKASEASAAETTSSAAVKTTHRWLSNHGRLRP